MTAEQTMVKLQRAANKVQRKIEERKRERYVLLPKFDLCIDFSVYQTIPSNVKIDSARAGWSV